MLDTKPSYEAAAAPVFRMPWSPQAVVDAVTLLTMEVASLYRIGGCLAIAFCFGVRLVRKQLGQVRR